MLAQIIERAARLKAGKVAVGAPPGDIEGDKKKGKARAASRGGTARAGKKAVRKPAIRTSTTRKRKS